MILLWIRVRVPNAYQLWPREKGFRSISCQSDLRSKAQWYFFFLSILKHSAPCLQLNDIMQILTRKSRFNSKSSCFNISCFVSVSFQFKLSSILRQYRTHSRQVWRLLYSDCLCRQMDSHMLGYHSFMSMYKWVNQLWSASMSRKRRVAHCLHILIICPYPCK